MVPNPTDYATLGSARRALNTLLESLVPQIEQIFYFSAKKICFICSIC